MAEIGLRAAVERLKNCTLYEVSYERLRRALVCGAVPGRLSGIHWMIEETKLIEIGEHFTRQGAARFMRSVGRTEAEVVTAE